MDDFSGDIPVVEFDDAEIARIKQNLGLFDLPEVDLPTSSPIEEPTNRKRRRKTVEEPSVRDEIFEPAKLTKRDEREVNERLQSILTGGTGILGLAKPYLAMTDDEAKAISEPLASYLVRNADTIPIARQVLENYDLLAITLGVMAYVVRVYHDRQVEVAEIRETRTKTVRGLGTAPILNEERPEVRESSFVSSADGEGGRI